MLRFCSILTLSTLLILNSGCSSEETKKLAETQKKLATAISLEKDLMPVFQRSCGVCHNRENSGSPATEHGVYYENIDDIMSKIGKSIIAGRPDASKLYGIYRQSIMVSDANLVMPPPGSAIPKWNSRALEMLAKWIAAGALNN